MRPRLTHAEVERARYERGRALLFFLTDRCPVGCGHCSVDSRADSPTISDWAAFEAAVAAVVSRPGLEVVGISGGEPFVERRGLTHLVDALVEAGRHAVPYTSGIWARRATPAWVRGVLRGSSCVYLSTDGFHDERVPGDAFTRAATDIVDAGAGLVVQVIGLPGMVEAATGHLEAAFGSSWERHAELSITAPLPVGRGEVVFRRRAGRPPSLLGRCPLLGSPTVRYDGAVMPCCNEQVIVGEGPARLRRQCHTAGEVAAALDHFAGDDLLAVLADAGAGALAAHPRFADLAGERFESVCQLCWAANARVGDLGGGQDRLLQAMGALSRPDRLAAR